MTPAGLPRQHLPHGRGYWTGLAIAVAILVALFAALASNVASQPTAATDPAAPTAPAPLASDSPSPAVASTSAAVAPAETRDRYLWPFASDSPWNLPRGSQATFEKSGPRVTAWLATTFTDKWHSGTPSYFPATLKPEFTQPISVASATDPLQTISDATHGVVYTIRMPADVAIAVGSDAHMGLVGTDGLFYESWSTKRLDATHLTSGRLKRVDLAGSGIGPQNGVRAYGGSMIAGQVRAWEVRAGVVKHAISMVIPWSLLRVDRAKSGWGYFNPGERTNDGVTAPGWPTGLDLGGFHKELGYVWPASEQDYASASPDHYTGVFGMGSYFSIPSSVDVTTLGLSPAALVLAHAIQDYGAYIVDTDGADAGIVIGNVEVDPATQAFRDALTSGLGGQIDKLRDAMRPVTNNSSDNPNGAPAGSTARRLRKPPTHDRGAILAIYCTQIENFCRCKK